MLVLVPFWQFRVSVCQACVWFIFLQLEALLYKYIIQDALTSKINCIGWSVPHFLMKPEFVYHVIK